MKDYKKILEGVVNIINTTEKSDIGFVNICSYIGENCPELKKSDDERIRKAIKYCIKQGFIGHGRIENVIVDDCLAWLEKQGEQKPNYCHHEVDLSGCSEEYRKAYYDGWNNCNQQHAQLEVEQNPDWSEEDKVKINRIVACLENLNVADNDILLKDVDWLKSLKDRVQPQTKQEWGKEDERNIQTVDSVIFYDKNLPEDTCMRLRNWLKSLRPQNRWKPSDEQMEALKGVQDGVFRLGILESLYQDLKKLREE